MKTIEYMAPKSEVIKIMSRTSVLLETSTGEGIGVGGESNEEQGG